MWGGGLSFASVGRQRCYQVSERSKEFINETFRIRPDNIDPRLLVWAPTLLVWMISGQQAMFYLQINVVHRSHISFCPDGFWFGRELLQWLLKPQFNMMVCDGGGGH